MSFLFSFLLLPLLCVVVSDQSANLFHCSRVVKYVYSPPMIGGIICNSCLQLCRFECDYCSQQMNMNEVQVLDAASTASVSANEWQFECVCTKKALLNYCQIQFESFSLFGILKSSNQTIHLFRSAALQHSTQVFAVNDNRLKRE